jgi:hypothetical protein
LALKWAINLDGKSALQSGAPTRDFDRFFEIRSIDQKVADNRLCLFNS